MSAAKHLLNMTLKAILEKANITDVSADDPTRANVVVLRKLTDSYRIAIAIMNFDPLAPDAWGDKQSNAIHDPTDGVWLPIRDMTGSFERLRGAILVQCNLSESGEDADTADEIIQEVLARSKAAIRQNLDKLMITDSYHENVFGFHIVEAIEIDSGGETSHITREYIRWTALSKAKEKHL